MRRSKACSSVQRKASNSPLLQRGRAEILQLGRGEYEAEVSRTQTSLFVCLFVCGLGQSGEWVWLGST